MTASHEQRLQSQTIDTSASPVWQLTYDDMPDDGFVDGMRLSTDCIARRIIEPIDGARYHEFPEHLGHRGHGFERIMVEWLEAVHGVHAVRELVVPWEFGESHLDLYLEQPAPAFDVDGGRALQVELKANKEAQVKTENVRQVQRQMFATERAIAAGKEIRYPVKVDGEWTWKHVEDVERFAEAERRIIVVDPTTWRIPDPRGVRVTITDTRRVELEEEWAWMERMMAKTAQQLRYDIEWEEAMPPCTCSACFRSTLFELPQELVGDARTYMHVRDEASDAEAERKIVAAILMAKLRKLQADAPALVDGKGSFVGGGVKVTIDARGALRVTESDAKPTAVLA